MNLMIFNKITDSRPTGITIIVNPSVLAIGLDVLLFDKLKGRNGQHSF